MLILNDKKQQEYRRHILSHILPNTICKLLNNAVIIINLWWSKGDSSFFTVGMGLATIFSFVLGYLLISSLNIGLTYEISRKRGNYQLVGIFYQRALLINFLFCVFLITPFLYVSKNMVQMFKSVDYIKTGYVYEEIGQTVGKYLYQLVPSIYAYAFYDTTQSFLQAQGHILAPLIIQVAAVLLHLILIQYLGPAWSKNTIDFLSAITIYTYIVTLKKPLKSWTQWTIKCIKGWRNHMKFLQIIGLTTYLQAVFFFFFFCCLGYKLQSDELSCHIFYISIYQILYLLFIGIKQGALSKIGFHIKQSEYELYKKQGIQSIKLFVLISITLVIFIFIYESQIIAFFFQNKSQIKLFEENYYLLALTIILDSFQMGFASLLKALNKNYSVLRMNLVIYTLTLILCYYLCYIQQYRLKGLWIGWIIGLVINCIGQLFCLLSRHHQIRHSFVKIQKKQKYPNVESKAVLSQSQPNITI